MPAAAWAGTRQQNPVAPGWGGEGHLPGAAQRRLQVDTQLVNREGVPEHVLIGQHHRHLAGGRRQRGRGVGGVAGFDGHHRPATLGLGGPPDRRRKAQQHADDEDRSCRVTATASLPAWGWRRRASAAQQATTPVSDRTASTAGRVTSSGSSPWRRLFMAAHMVQTRKSPNTRLRNTAPKTPCPDATGPGRSR